MRLKEERQAVYSYQTLSFPIRKYIFCWRTAKNMQNVSDRRKRSFFLKFLHKKSPLPLNRYFAEIFFSFIQPTLQKQKLFFPQAKYLKIMMLHASLSVIRTFKTH
jgi:hypothetical protein